MKNKINTPNIKSTIAAVVMCLFSSYLNAQSNQVSASFDTMYNSHTLIWETNSEVNTSYFEIEYSTDSLNFEFMKTIDASGSVTLGTKYALEDIELEDSTTYIRITLVDMQGFRYQSNTLEICQPISAINNQSANKSPT
jgi:hypothetical protein